MNIEEYLKDNKEPVLNLGCGRTKRPNEFGIDIMDIEGVDLVADCNELIDLPDNSFSMIIAQDFLEHIDPKKNIQIMEECFRLLKFGGRLAFEVPSTDGNNMGAFQDPTHYSFWNEKKFWYFMDDQYGQGFRSLYDIKAYFKPLMLQTYWNQHNVTYVKGVLEKELK